ncbi:MAG TPA: alpha/beta fold hydrolase [Candidatus Limnocylindrales bacterium]|nr:alpha/beta fold hydrolase [Candidatus Limnocylindrales bacterium]
MSTAVSSSVRSAANWLEHRDEVSDPRIRLFCFPHAGGSASFYSDWPRLLAPQVETVAVQLPGRGRLMREPFCTTIAEAADALTPLVADSYLPVVLLGHSMGAILAFEVAARLDALRQPPLHLVCTARPAPSIPSPERPVSGGSRGELVNVLRDYDATPPEVFEDDELLDLMLPVIRADFHMIESYRCVPGLRVTAPISVFGGTEDPGVPVEAIHAWSGHTSGSFSARLLPGGHFFVTRYRDEILDAVRDFARHACR